MNEKNDAVFIELDRPRELRLGHKALKCFSALRHVPLSKMQEAVEDYDSLSCLYYCVLRQEDPTLTVEQVDELLDKAPLPVLLAKAGEMITAAFGGSEETAGGDADPMTAAAGTGSAV